MSIKVKIVGGTHGNEFSGIHLVRKWQTTPSLIERDGLNVSTMLANPQAHEANRRYLDVDLNRQFLPELLADPALANYEQSRAKVINAQLGPKGASATDLVIDLHNTTSNMGPTLIVLDSGEWERRLAAYVKANMPEAVILVEDEISSEKRGYLCSIGKRGVMVEVGPQPQSVLRHDILEQMEQMTLLILDFVSLNAKQQLPQLPKQIEAFRYLETHRLPLDDNGKPVAMVHRRLEGADFKPLNNGEPIFQCFDGSVQHYDGEAVLYPHFVNEAAYYDSHTAFSLAERIDLDVP